jgi:hypothetical protein
MTQPDAFLDSAKERADEKGMRVDVYLARQIELSALALGRVCGSSDKTSPESTAVAFDVRELTDAAERLQNVVEMEYEA